MKNLWAKFHELIFSPIAILVAALAYYAVYKIWGPEAGLIPPGYFTNILAGAAVMYIAGWMATLALMLNFNRFYLFIFDWEKIEGQIPMPLYYCALCAYFAFYALSIWALTSML